VQPDETFDTCLNIVTLEHVREPARALGEIARKSKLSTDRGR